MEGRVTTTATTHRETMTTAEKLSRCASEGHVPPALADQASDELEALTAERGRLLMALEDIASFVVNANNGHVTAHAMRGVARAALKGVR